MSQDERKFLHDMANPVATALFVADALLEELELATDIADRLSWVEQLKSVATALEKTRDLIRSRREILVGKAST